MKKHLRGRKNPESEDSEENLRGKNRELTKQLDAERRRSRALEKRLSKLLTPGTPIEVETPKKKKPDLCPGCGKEDCRKDASVPGPNGTYMHFLVCQICGDREKKDDVPST